MTQACREALVATMCDFTIDEQSEPIGMGEHRAVAGGFKFGEGLGQARKPELVQLIKYRMGQQCPFSLRG